MERGRAIQLMVAAALALMVILLAAGPGTPLLNPPTGDLSAERFDLTVSNDPGEQTPEQRNIDDEEPRGDVPLELIVIIVLVTAVLAVVLRWLLRREAPESREPTEQASAELVLAATSEEARRAALAQGDPRNAVVACWVALEDAADRAGLRRDGSETSLEFATRLLARWNVPADVVAELGALYREARFSAHPVSEDQRRAAVTALEVIHEQILRRVRAQQREQERKQGSATAEPTT